MKNQFGVERSEIKKGFLVNTTSSIGFGVNLGRTRGGYKIKFSNGFEIARFDQIRQVEKPKAA